MPALLTARGFAYHVRTLMDAHVVLSPSFPFPCRLSKERLLGVYIRVRFDPCLASYFRKRGIGKKRMKSIKCRIKSPAKTAVLLRSRPSYGLNERTTSRDIALCSANHIAMLHLDINNLNHVGEQIKSRTAHDVLLVQIERNFNFKERVINLTRSPCYTVQSW